MSQKRGRREKDHIWIIRWTKTQELGCCSGTWEEADEYSQEEEQRRLHHIRISLWRTRFITGIGMLVGLFYASGAAITYSISVKVPGSTLERVLIGLAVSASFYALNSIARTLEKQIKK